MKIQLLIPGILCVFFWSCSNGSTEVPVDSDSTDIVCIMPAPNRINEVLWLAGEWENEDQGIRSTESWVQTSETLLNGISLSVDMETGDTVFYEALELRHESTGLVYAPTVADQNDGEQVSFLLTDLNDSLFVFENPDHDYPTKIVYQRFGEDSLVATISGLKEGKSASDIFPMKRVK
ncbi:MAG: hypothetical protein HYZ14_06345 [Bacteroidetes bacterium]|nr:hypothetical protein [Bacteroidota bacterium]